MSELRKKRLKNLITIIKLMALMIIVIGIPLIIYFNYHELLENFGSLEKVQEFLENNSKHIVWGYLLLQIAQLVICIIPGQAVQLTGGYMFNFWLGFILTMGGCAIGTFIAFYISRVLGKDAMYLFFGQKKLDGYIDKLNSKRAYLLLFIIYLIPGIPKDLFAYAIGVSNMRFIPFFWISMVGRSPAMICSLIVGVMIRTGSYTSALILCLIVLVMTVIGIWKRDKINDFSDFIYSKLSKN